MWHVTRPQCLSGHKVSPSQLACSGPVLTCLISHDSIDSWHSPHSLMLHDVVWCCWRPRLWWWPLHCSPSTRVCVISSCPRSEAPGQQHTIGESRVCFYQTSRNIWKETGTCSVQPALGLQLWYPSFCGHWLTTTVTPSVSWAALKVWLYLWFQSDAVAAV